MTGDNDKDKKGFSGLSDLASKISGIDDAVSSEAISETKPSHSTQGQKGTPRSEPERKPTTSNPPIKTIGSGKSGGGSGGKWILSIIAVLFAIWLANKGEQSGNKLSYKPPSPSSSPARTVVTSHNPLTVQQTMEVQKLLQELGYDPGQVDGKYDKRTERAVKAFQKDRGLPLDGLINQNLLNTLEKTKAAKALAQEIENEKAQARQMEKQIKNMDHRLENYEREMRSYRDFGMVDEYNSLVPVFNSLANERNALYEKYRSLITEVNAKVNRFNSTYR